VVLLGRLFPRAVAAALAALGPGRPASGKPYERQPGAAPYPPSKAITGLTWAPKGAIVRKARGSDNWPLTWADDGHQYTAYLGVYDAPEPRGPWATAYFAGRWDVGPGGAASFPAKWMSADGRTAHLVFSGDDHFAVRQATLRAAGARGPPPG
jgi:hypothetical protein